MAGRKRKKGSCLISRMSLAEPTDRALKGMNEDVCEGILYLVVGIYVRGLSRRNTDVSLLSSDVSMRSCTA